MNLVIDRMDGWMTLDGIGDHPIDRLAGRTYVRTYVSRCWFGLSPSRVPWILLSTSRGHGFTYDDPGGGGGLVGLDSGRLGFG